MIFSSGIRSIAPAAAPDDAYFLDVRESDEWSAGHILDAVHLPIGEIIDRVDEIPGDREIICVCRVGGRSAQVAMFLERQGFKAVNLDGGLEAWLAAGRPLVSETEHPATVI